VGNFRWAVLSGAGRYFFAGFGLFFTVPGFFAWSFDFIAGFGMPNATDVFLQVTKARQWSKAGQYKSPGDRIKLTENKGRVGHAEACFMVKLVSW
jgi:hypothetical protein